MLLVCGFLVSCFSVDAFAADDSGQQILMLGGGDISIYWHSSYNGDSVSYGNFDSTPAHKYTITSVNFGKNQTDYPFPKLPVLEATTLTFRNTFRLLAGRQYYVAFKALPISYNNHKMKVQVSFYDQYNICCWATDSDTFIDGRGNGGNGFTYAVLDCPVTFDVKKIRIQSIGDVAWTDKTFDVNYSDNTRLNIVRLAKNGDVDSVVKAIQDQTASDQSRYDDFTSNGSEQGSSAVESTQQSVSEKIGILDFAEGVLSDFIGLFSADPGDATLTLPGFKWHDSDTGEDLTVWDSQTFDFAFVEQHFGPLVSALRVGTVLAVYGALLWYLQAVFDRIFGGGDGN